MGEAVKFKYGTADKFRTIEKESNTIYFITDTTNDINQIYLGDKCYTVSIVSDINDTTTNGVPSTQAVLNAINNKQDIINVMTMPDIELPDTVYISNNMEYRYNNINNATSIKIGLSGTVTPDSTFYCSVVIHSISSSTELSEFITFDNTTIPIAHILNGETDLTDMTTLELLFFYNGTSMCCIGGVYQ